MPTGKPRRITRELTPAEQARLEEVRAKVAEELPELLARNQMRHDARKELTLSGALRRAIHAGPHSVPKLAELVGITSLALDQFLTGEQTLTSDVIDRLASVLSCELQRASSD